METVKKLSPAENIVLNLQAGLLPKNLSKKEVQILKSAYGKDWFTKLGYSEETHEKPKH